MTKNFVVKLRCERSATVGMTGGCDEPPKERFLGLVISHHRERGFGSSYVEKSLIDCVYMREEPDRHSVEGLGKTSSGYLAGVGCISNFKKHLFEREMVVMKERR